MPVLLETLLAYDCPTLLDTIGRSIVKFQAIELESDVLREEMIGDFPPDTRWDLRDHIDLCNGAIHDIEIIRLGIDQQSDLDDTIRPREWNDEELILVSALNLLFRALEIKLHRTVGEFDAKLVQWWEAGLLA